MLTLSEAYAQGRQAATEAARFSPDLLMRDFFQEIPRTFPELAGVDLAAELLRFDRERMANPPDPHKYPETRHLPDLLREERRGFLEAAGGNELLMAYHYTWYYYYSRRILTRYLPATPTVERTECTAVVLTNTSEGGPLYGRNWDILLNDWAQTLMEPPREAADGSRRMWIKTVSAPVFLDDEPAEIFPVDPFELLPQECTHDVRDAVAFLSRYRDFWGPGNSILVDTHLGSVAIEKANCRMGVRDAVDGASAVTALSYLTPEMHAYKLDRDRESIRRRGWTEENAPDWTYWRGADARHRRLLDLTAKAAKRPATLDDMAAIVTDHAVPYPDRVCLAGESCCGLSSDEAEWTGVSHSEVLEGPNRRLLFYRVEGRTACYDTPPFLILGPGVTPRPEWEHNTRPLPTKADKPRPRIYREYPHIRVML